MGCQEMRLCTYLEVIFPKPPCFAGVCRPHPPVPGKIGSRIPFKGSCVIGKSHTRGGLVLEPRPHGGSEVCVRQLIAGAPQLFQGRSSSSSIHYRIVAYNTAYRGQKTQLTLGVIHSDKPWGQTTTNPIVKHATYYMHSLEDRNPPPNHSP